MMMRSVPHFLRIRRGIQAKKFQDGESFANEWAMMILILRPAAGKIALLQKHGRWLLR